MDRVQQERSALVVYGSETGNAQDVAEEMGRITERLRFQTEVVELNAISLKQLLQQSIVLISISTTGQGELPPNSQAFWRTIRSARLRPGCLQQMRFASFGLGDSSYPKFNWAHRKLYNRLIQLSAQPVCDRGESDEQHPEGVDGAFSLWSAKLKQHLLEAYPLPEGVEPIPDTELLEPKWLLELADPAHAEPTPAPDSAPSDTPPSELLDIPGGLVATIASNKRVTPLSHWQDVRHLDLTIPGQHPYVPGDTLTIYPKNFPSDVNELLKTMGWSTFADRPLKFISTSSSSSSTPSPSSPLPVFNLSQSASVTLRGLLTNHLDIMSIPRRSFFAQLAHFTEDEFQRDRLVEFTNPEYLDELYDYTTRPRRSILEILQEFDTVKIPWQRVCSIIPAMRGRQFSIASAFGRVDGLEKAAETSVELLVAIVKYRTVIKRIRQGVCTRYIASLQPGQEVGVTLQKGGLNVTKAETEKPVIMIGPGTGVAPMRSLIYQRRSWREEIGKGTRQWDEDILCFGCRNASADYFFASEWSALRNSREPFDVIVAFSRDQRQKLYVQDLIREHSARVYDALGRKGGLVYICGSSGKMPQAVREALIETFQTHGQMSRGDAEAYLAGMEKTGRYKQETW